MKRFQAILLRSIILLLPLFLLSGCFMFRDTSYRDAESISIPDIIFYPEKGIPIPLQVKEDATSGLFKVRDNISQLADKLRNISSPRVVVKEENERYFIIEVRDDESRVSNGIIFEATGKDSMAGWHYYAIEGFYRGVASAELKYIGWMCWPRQLFPLRTIDTNLISGEELETEATIDDFETFYQQVNDQRGMKFERKDNTIILPKSFLYSGTDDREMKAVLTFGEGTVRVDIEPE